MATVRITNDIRRHVRDKLDALYSARTEHKRQELQNLDIGNICYQHYVPAKYRDLAQQLNADLDDPWLDVANKIVVQMSYLTNAANHTWITGTFTVPLKPPVPLPKRLREHGAKFKLLESMAPYEHAKKILLEISAMTEERNKLINQLVDGVLTKCSTLHQVLELWPSALEFMPDEVKQKHAAKTKKRKSVAEKLSIDPDVKVSLMNARILAAGN